MNPNANGNYNGPSSQDLNNDINDNNNPNIALDLIKNKLEKFQKTIIEDVEHKMDNLMTDIIQEIRLYEMKKIEFPGFAQEQYNQIWKNRQPITNKASNTNNTKKHIEKLPEKIFMARESYLTALLEINHIRSIYNFFIIILIFTFLHNILYGYYIENSINIGLDSIRLSFGNLHIAIGIWFLLHIPVLLVFYGFQLWAQIRQKLIKNTTTSIRNCWDRLCLIIFLMLLTCFGYYGFQSCLKYQLNFGSTGCLLCEIIRLIMKMHSFVRTNITKQLIYEKNYNINAKSTSKNRIILLKNYIYYLFAPTLIYRDEYPRTKFINWKFILKCLLEILSVMLIVALIHERYMRPYYMLYGSEKTTIGSIILKLFGTMMPGLIIFLSIFYCVLHSWLNLTSELLKFADRMFYRDWWTVGNYDIYYRYWNTVIHDYLYEYIYKDIYLYNNRFMKNSKILASFCVFFISAFIHEIMLSYALHFIYPVMFFFFIGIGGILIIITRFTTHTIGNIIILCGAGMGNGLMMSFYYMEYYSRKNCPIVNNELYDYFKWVSWRCNGLDLEI